MKKYILFSIASLLGTFGFSQITVTNTMTPAQLVNNILIGSGVTATNIKVNGSLVTANNVQVNAASFGQNGTSFPIPNGVLLTTGNAIIAKGPNNSTSATNAVGTSISTDADLNSIAAAAITNGITLEFDFLATGNQLEFDYMFGSEEYPEFSPSSFNDVFGFFLSGPGLSGPYTNSAVNIATLPGTSTPVTINNVNPTTNNIYYVNNGSGAAYGNAIQYDGTTITLTAFADLICGETYHIKLGIANVGDQSYDSGVFIKGGSFTTNPVNFSFQTFTLNNTIYEGCNQLGTLMFTRQGCGNENDTLVAYTDFVGQAINGVDYQLLGDSVVLLPGIDTVYWQIIPFEDNLVEGIESVIINIMSIVNGDTIYSSGTFYISDVPVINVNAQNVSYQCYQNNSPINATVTGGFAPYSYLWSTGDTTLNTSVPITGNGVTGYLLTVTDACGYIKSDSAYVTMNQTISIDTIMMGPATCDPVGWVSALTSGNTNPINITFTWTNANDTNFVYPDQSALPDLSGGWYYLTLTDDNIPCSVRDSILVTTTDTPQAIATAINNYGCGPLITTFGNNSNNSTSYVWDFGDGNVVNTTNLDNQIHTFSTSGTVTLTASNGNPSCDNSTTIAIQIIECGCTDPNAINYNPNAVESDGSCAYPIPVVTAPNVITANGDNVNGYFFLQTTYAESIELTILNRWGNAIFEGYGDQNNQPYWNGENKNGILVEDGVYFYRYKVTGIQGDVIEGHGFVQVVR